MELRPLFRALLILVLVTTSVGRAANPPARPNILFLLSDDQSYPFLSCFGDGNVHTPNIDRLAAEGMKFHRFFTTAPQCVPSRASLMTGRSPVAARITRFSSTLPREETVFPEWLRSEAGYYTGVCGRTYHLDGAPGNRIGIGEVLEAHHLRTFKERMDFVDVSPAPEVAGGGGGFPGSQTPRITIFFS